MYDKKRLVVRDLKNGQKEIALQDFCAGYKYDRYTAFGNNVPEALYELRKQIKIEIIRRKRDLDFLNSYPLITKEENENI